MLNKIVKKAFASLAVVALVGAGAVTLSSCGEETTASSNDGIISVFNGEPENGLVPGNTTESVGGNVLDVIFAGLITYKSDGSYENEVAKSIETTDNQHFDVKLNDWKWSDGRDLDAEDFVQAWSFTANAKNAQLGSSFFDVVDGFEALNPEDDADVAALTGKEQLSGLTVVSPKEFTIDLTEPSSTFVIRLGNTAYFPVPVSALADIENYGEKPVSNGPYKVEEWNHQENIKVVPNEYYKGSKEPKNKGIDFKVISDTDAGYTMIQSGSLDVMDTVPASQAATFLDDSTVQGHTEASPIVEQFTIPVYLKHFGDDAEGQLRRQAISLAVDRQTVIDKVLQGRAISATSFTTSAKAINGVDDNIEGNDVLKYDATKAKELWAKADAIDPWLPTESFKISFNSNGGGASLYEAVANSIKNALGIDAQADAVVDFKTLRTAANAGTMTTALRAGWIPDYPSVENYLQPLFAAKGSSNDSHYDNPAFDTLLSQAASSKTLTDANKLFSKAQAILMEDLPQIPLYSRNASTVLGKNINGYQLTWKGEADYINLSK